MVDLSSAATAYLVLVIALPPLFLIVVKFTLAFISKNWNKISNGHVLPNFVESILKGYFALWLAFAVTIESLLTICSKPNCACTSRDYYVCYVYSCTVPPTSALFVVFM
jgi:hypothetical protein